MLDITEAQTHTEGISAHLPEVNLNLQGVGK